MKNVILILTIFASCKKAEVKPTQKEVIVRAYAHNEKSPADGLNYWKPGVIFYPGIDATGSATITWWYKSDTYTQVLSYSVTKNNTSYFEFSTHRAATFHMADSVKLTAFTANTGADIKVVIK